MQFLILFPLLYHVRTLWKKRNLFFLHAGVALVLFIVALYLKSPYFNGGILLMCMMLDMKKEILLYVVSVVVFYVTMQLPYYLLLWVFMEMAFVFHDKILYTSYETQLQNYQNKVFDKQVQEVEHMFMTMRGWRHDYHNHLQNLKVKLRRNEVLSSLQYLDELEKELQDIHMLVESENTNLDAILNSKLSLAVAQGITIHVKVKVAKELTINDTDLCALLGNLIDNAVEACANVQSEKFIRFYIGQYKGQLYISCTNSTAEEVRKLDEEYISTKRGNHGHGLKRMNQIIEKYEGSINRKNEPGVFLTEILLPM